MFMTTLSVQINANIKTVLYSCNYVSLRTINKSNKCTDMTTQNKLVEYKLVSISKQVNTYVL
jgi:hypothetical protein